MEDSELYKEARLGPSFGLLPKGTLLRLLGEQTGRFVSVEVELQSGTLEGWVVKQRLNLEEQSREELLEESRRGDDKPKNARELAPRIKRSRVPKDEGLLLRRQPTFFYGPNVAGVFSIINASTDSFTGMGFSAGGHVGTFLGRDLPLRFELTYLSLNGLGQATAAPVSFGFLETALSLAYQVNDLELVARTGYAFAMGVSTLPGALNGSFGAISELSTLWIGGGIGYQFTFSEITHATVRAMYGVGLIQSPFVFQTIGIQALLDFQG